MKNHILPHYEDALNKLQEDVTALGNKVLNALHELSSVLPEKKIDTAYAVISDEESLAEEASELRRLSDSILAQFHPVASDLRHVVGLSRCVDKIRDIIQELASMARRLKMILEEDHVFERELDPLFSLAFQELEGALLALWTKESSLARSVRAQDKELDAKHRELMKDIIETATKRKVPVHQNVHLLFIVRSLERVGDNAKGICASIVFMKEAQDIRHSGGKKQLEK